MFSLFLKGMLVPFEGEKTELLTVIYSDISSYKPTSNLEEEQTPGCRGLKGPKRQLS